jgi:uncharacterized protein YabE (DUF348 family)
MRRKFKEFFRHPESSQTNNPRLHRHPFVVPVVTFIALAALVTTALLVRGGGNNFRPGDAYIVKVTVNGKEQTLPTKAANVGELLGRLNITLGSNDVVEPGVDTPIVEDFFRVNVYRARPVLIVDGDHKVRSVSAASTPRTIARQAGVTVYPEDSAVSEPIDNILKDGIGEKVVITRSVPITLNLYGTPVASRTLGKTVSEVLKEKEIKLTEGESTAPAGNTPVAAGMQIFVLGKGTQIQVVEEAIEAPRQVIEDASLSFGTSVVRQAGSAGKKVVTYAVVNASGERQKIQEIIVQNPVTEIVARGKAVQIPGDKTAVMNAAGIAPSDHAYVNFIMSHESGWCPTKLQGQIGYCPPYPPDSIPSNKGYGLGQATPGTKMSPFGADWKTNPVTQLRWADSYAKSRHGGWAGAYNFWQARRHW